MDVSNQLERLLSRMPELEWQLGKLGSAFSVKSLPKALFRQSFDAPVLAYVAEIREDIATLSLHSNERVIRYLALKINQKINVLVTICFRHNREQPEPELVNYAVDKISTRQQWLQSLEANIQTLDAQREALAASLVNSNNVENCQLQLNLQRELGVLEKRLTLARETWNRATGIG